MARRISPPISHRCGIDPDVLDATYAALCVEYEELGRAPIFTNGLYAARAYLRQWPAPFRLGQHKWFTGDQSNRARIKRGEVAIGYQLRTDLSRCACMDTHPFKKGKNYPTCVHLQIVTLYQRASYAY